MQRGDRSYRKSENCKTAVNKGCHNVSSFFANAFPALMVFKLFSSKLWLFLKFYFLKCYNGNGKVIKVF